MTDTFSSKEWLHGNYYKKWINFFNFCNVTLYFYSFIATFNVQSLAKIAILRLSNNWQQTNSKMHSKLKCRVNMKRQYMSK